MIYQMSERMYRELRKARMTHSAILEYVNTVLCNTGNTFSLDYDLEKKCTYIKHREPIIKFTEIITYAD
ncbi:MAG: hypothetical protein ABIJ40_07275 [Bacteroidota bacterium]